MSFTKIAGILLGSAAMVAGHGFVSGAVVDGTYYTGYLVNNYPYQSNPPDSIGWAEEATDLGFVDGSGYTSGDIICHKNAKPGAISADLKAGGKVEFQWTEWPESHHGPVITYMANCNGDCATVDKTQLEFFKIEEKGLISSGNWASDELIANNNTWTVTVPSSLAAGNYVIRHEIIGLHSAGNANGAQNYPQCINVKLTGGGSDQPAGTLGTKLYTPTDPGILVNIYTDLTSYEIPGPALWTGGSSSGGSDDSSSAPAATATTAPTTTAAPSVVITSTPTQKTQVPDVTAAPSSSSAPIATSAPSTPSSSSAPIATSAPSTPSSTPALPSDGSLTEYFNSLSPEQFLSVLKQTFSWLVTEKAHARSLSA